MPPSTVPSTSGWLTLLCSQCCRLRSPAPQADASSSAGWLLWCQCRCSLPSDIMMVMMPHVADSMRGSMLAFASRCGLVRSFAHSESRHAACISGWLSSTKRKSMFKAKSLRSSSEWTAAHANQATRLSRGDGEAPLHGLVSRAPRNELRVVSAPCVADKQKCGSLLWGSGVGEDGRGQRP